MNLLLPFLVQCGSFRKSETSPTSVNCVTLNAIPGRNTSRLIVGSRMEVNGQNAIMANDSTIMPDINGIATLVYMMFAPMARVQMEPDDEKLKNDSRSVHLMCLKNNWFREMSAGLGKYRDMTVNRNFVINEAHEARFDTNVNIDQQDIDTCLRIRRMIPSRQPLHPLLLKLILIP